MFSSFRISQEIQATVEAESDLEAGGGEGVIVEKPLLHRPAVYSLFLEYSLSVCVYLGRLRCMLLSSPHFSNPIPYLLSFQVIRFIAGSENVFSGNTTKRSDSEPSPAFKAA